MKNKKNSLLNGDSQSRLIAYTTAAGLGAFMAAPNADAQVTLSPAFPSYPVTLTPGAGTGAYGNYNYFSVDGGASPQFNLTMNGPIPVDPSAKQSQFFDMPGLGTSANTTNGNSGLTPVPADPYLVSFLGGTTIDATNAAPPTYEPRLAISYLVASPYGGWYYYLDSKYKATGTLGFQFIGSVDGKIHYGYMDIEVTTTKNGPYALTSEVIQDIYYNATPNAAITVPIKVNITGITVGAGNAVTITFTSNDNAAASDFTLLTSPALGASASWAADPNATIAMLTPANPSGGVTQATYQAVTTGTGGPSQFYEVTDSN